MRIDLEPPGGGVLITGTEEELDGLRETLADAVYSEEREAEGKLLTDMAVETVTVRVIEEDADAS